MRNGFRKLTILCWIATALTVSPALYATGNTVARVTDIEGAAMQVVDGVKKKLRILARVRDGAVIEMDRGAMLTLHFAAKKRDLRFVGPGTVKVRGHSAEASNGVAGTKDHEDIGISLDLTGSGLGGIIARGLNVPKPKVNLQHPVKSKVIAGRPLEFGWSAAGPTAVYDLSVKLSGGQIVFRGRTTETRFRLPGGIRLEPGRRYRWSVTTDSGNGDVTQTSAKFETADLDETARFYAMGGLNNGTVSDRVLFALTLDDMKLTQEAEQIWAQLEKIHPDIRQAR